jgi:hypothetical protein
MKSSRNNSVSGGNHQRFQSGLSVSGLILREGGKNTQEHILRLVPHRLNDEMVAKPAVAFGNGRGRVIKYAD